jgi:hypothetical protein
MAWIDLRTHTDGTRALEEFGVFCDIDLHALWACARGTREGGLAPPGVADPEVGLLLELDPAAGQAERQALRALAGVPSIYRLDANFLTGSLPLARLCELKARPGLKHWRIGQPQGPRERAQEAFRRPPAPPSPQASPWIGLIDHGIAFGHRQFRRAAQPGRSRFAAFWDQDATRLLPGRNALAAWQALPGLGRGAALSAAAIDGLIARFGGDDLRLYRELAYEPAQAALSHGTHVLDLAAGRPHPLRGPADAEAEWDGWASHAPIVAVQLPYRPRKDSAGQGLGPDVLEALHFIERSVPAGHPVVVNLSDGAYGGPHDGLSLAERAIDDFLVRHKRVQLVVAAGNAAALDLHAEGRAERGRTLSIQWAIQPDDRTDSCCEIWFDQALDYGAVRIRLEPPGGWPAVELPLGDHRVWRPAGQALASAAVLSAVQSANHEPAASAVLLAVAPTASGGPGAPAAPTAPHGLWRIHITNLAHDGALPVHLWVERDDPVVGEAGPRRQSRLLPLPGGGLDISALRVLGSLAGGASTYVVGGRYRRGDGAPPYVSNGPGRARGLHGGGPDVTAPSDESRSVPGLLAAGSRSGTRLRMDGTSVAAPLVTRRLVNLLNRGYATPDRLRQALGGGAGAAAAVQPGQEPP